MATRNILGIARVTKTVLNNPSFIKAMEPYKIYNNIGVDIGVVDLYMAHPDFSRPAVTKDGIYVVYRHLLKPVVKPLGVLEIRASKTGDAEWFNLGELLTRFQVKNLRDTESTLNEPQFMVTVAEPIEPPASHKELLALLKDI